MTAADTLPFEDSMQARFEAFSAAHPEVLEHLRRLTAEWVAAGKGRFGIRMAWEVMRWQMSLGSTDPGEYRLNNNYTSRYARILAAEFPGVFELREVRAA